MTPISSTTTTSPEKISKTIKDSIERTIKSREEYEDIRNNSMGIRMERLVPEMLFVQDTPLTVEHLFTPIKEGREALQWELNGKQITIIRDTHFLKAEEKNIETNTILGEYELPFEKELGLRYYSACTPIIESNSTKLLPIVYGQSNEKFAVTLLNNEGRELIWKVYNKETKQGSWLSFQLATIASERCHINSSISIYELMKEPITKVSTMLKNHFNIHGAHFGWAVLSPFSVLIEPKAYTCIREPRMLVSADMWAVRLIAYGGKSGAHAAILIEGVVNNLLMSKFCTRIDNKETISSRLSGGKKFVWISEFNPEIKSYPKNPEYFSYQQSTEIWMVPAKKVEKMLKKIKDDYDYQYAMTKLRPSYQHDNYDIYGISSIFSNSKDNCFSWTVHNLKILDIYVKIPFSFFASHIKMVTKSDEQLAKIKVTPWI